MKGVETFIKIVLILILSNQNSANIDKFYPKLCQFCQFFENNLHLTNVVIVFLSHRMPQWTYHSRQHLYLGHASPMNLTILLVLLSWHQLIHQCPHAYVWHMDFLLSPWQHREAAEHILPMTLFCLIIS